VKATIFVTLLAFFPILSSAALPEGYGRVPNASERSKDSNYYIYSDFRLHVVKEDEGTPDEHYNLIQDADLKRKLDNKEFLSLQVRDLAIKTGSNAIYAEGNTVHFPYAVSVKHTQRENSGVNQGTIEVTGEIIVHVNGDNLRVEVVKFYDSSGLERAGRRILGANADIDLNFAKKVVPPVLEGYFRKDPSRVRALLDLIPKASLPQKL
jgi:hypothetical protein